MIDLTESHTLADFHRDSTAHVKRLKETGQPEVLTVNGEAELVVQSAGGVSEAARRRGDGRNVADFAEELGGSKAGRRATGGCDL